MPVGQPAPRRRAKKPPQAKTVEKALRLLAHLGAARGPVALQDVARGVGLHPSTAYRLLAVLVRHRFVQTGPESRRYALGLRLAELGHAALDALELRAKARPTLERLMRESRETVNLMVLDGETGIYVDRVEGPQRVRVAASIGYRELLHCSAIGKAILGHLADERLAPILARGLPSLTRRTLSDPRHLRRHLREVRARGFAIDNEEGEVGIRCVGAPVFDHQGHVIAALSVSGPAYRLTLAQLGAWGPRVAQAGLAVSSALGFRPEVAPSRVVPDARTPASARPRR